MVGDRNRVIPNSMRFPTWVAAFGTRQIIVHTPGFTFTAGATDTIVYNTPLDTPTNYPLMVINTTFQQTYTMFPHSPTQSYNSIVSLEHPAPFGDPRIRLYNGGANFISGNTYTIGEITLVLTNSYAPSCP